jgi:hypothetical protein
MSAVVAVVYRVAVYSHYGYRLACLCGRLCSGWRGRRSHGVRADPR